MDRKETALSVLARVSGMAAENLRPELELVAELGLDSPKALRLVADLEDELEIEISDEQVAAMQTVGDVLAFAGS